MSSWLKAAESFLDGVDDSETTHAENLAVHRVSDNNQSWEFAHDMSFRTEDTRPKDSEVPRKDLNQTSKPVRGLRDQLQSRRQGGSNDAKLAAVSSRSTARKKGDAPATPEPHQPKGNPREAKLQKQCDDLRKTLNDSKEENSRLQDLLHSATSNAKSSAKELECLKNEVDENNAASLRREATLQAEAVAKDLELNKMNNDLASTKKWAAELEAQVVALQGTNQKLMDDRRANEGLISEALQRELAEVERQLEQERGERAAATKSTGVREETLQQELSESASALARMQRQLDERNMRVVELEHQMSDLRRELQEAARAPQAVKTEVSTSESDMMGDIQEQLNAAQLETEQLQSDVVVANRRVQELEDMVEGLQQQISDGAVQLEQRLKEVTELLYEKQEQYEKLSSERASQQFAMDHKLRMLQEELDSERRKLHSQSVNQANASGLDTVIPMDSLGEAFYNLAHHKRVGKAVRTGAQFLDSTASKVVFLLRQYPLWRLGVFAYLFIIHLYCYILINRLQKHVMVEAEHALPGTSRTI